MMIISFMISLQSASLINSAMAKRVRERGRKKKKTEYLVNRKSFFG